MPSDKKTTVKVAQDLTVPRVQLGRSGVAELRREARSWSKTARKEARVWKRAFATAK